MEWVRGHVVALPFDSPKLMAKWIGCMAVIWQSVLILWSNRNVECIHGHIVTVRSASSGSRAV